MQARIEQATSSTQSRGSAVGAYEQQVTLEFKEKPFHRSMHSKFASLVFRRSLSAGFFDVALLMANVSQLKIMLNTNELTAQILVVIAFIALSMTLQLIAGIMLVFTGYFEQNENVQPTSSPMPPDANTEEAANDHYEKMKEVGRIHEGVSNLVTVVVFMILIINVIISGMGIGLPITNLGIAG